jgi:hypothetical protein
VPDYAVARIEVTTRIRSLDLCVVLLSAAALFLLGPLRGVFEAFPLVPFLSALVLFMAPGMLLSHWYFNERFPGAAFVPVSFVISTGIFGLLGVPMLILQASLDVYLWVAGAIVAASLAAAVVRMLLRRTPAEGDTAASSPFSWLWVPFLLLSAALAAVSRSRVPTSYDDMWIYLAWVREFLSTDSLALYEPYFGNEAGLSRARINGWLLEQAALSRVSGIDPIELVLRYLAPTLVVVALLAFYTLARTLFKREAVALFAGCLCALFYLVNLDASLLSFGGEFIGRVAEDKFAARFVFLPVALALAVAFLQSGKPRYLWVFAFICWAVMAVHPVGLVIIGLSMAGFGLVYLAVNWRDRQAWTMMVGLGVTILSVVLVSAIFVFLATGESLTAVLSDADINSGDPDVLANMVFVRPERERIFELGEDLYMMHPSLLLDPVILGSFLLGLPFLLRRLRHSLAAQLLVGVLLLVTVVCYVPQVATFVGDHLVLPGQLWRLAWPIPLAALLIAGWMAWETTGRAEGCLNRLGVTPSVTHFLPLVLLGALMWVAAPTSVARAEEVHSSEEVAQSQRSCVDPVFRWIGANITEPSVVLAPDAENTCIPAYSASANVVSLRGGTVLGVLPILERRVPGRIEVPRGTLDVRSFFSGPTLEESVQILHRHEVDYVLLYANPSLGKQPGRLPGITAIKTPGERYSMYAVDHLDLGEKSRAPR